jgi:hypothetical protein
VRASPDRRAGRLAWAHEAASAEPLPANEILDNTFLTPSGKTVCEYVVTGHLQRFTATSPDCSFRLVAALPLMAQRSSAATSAPECAPRCRCSSLQ